MWSLEREREKRKAGEGVWLKSCGQTMGQGRFPEGLIHLHSCGRNCWNEEPNVGHLQSQRCVWKIVYVFLPVACGRYEVYAAVHPGVWDPLLPVDVDLLLEIRLVLVINELHDGLPAGPGQG